MPFANAFYGSVPDLASNSLIMLFISNLGLPPQFKKSLKDNIIPWFTNRTQQWCMLDFRCEHSRLVCNYVRKPKATHWKGFPISCGKVLCFMHSTYTVIKHRNINFCAVSHPSQTWAHHMYLFSSLSGLQLLRGKGSCCEMEALSVTRICAWINEIQPTEWLLFAHTAAKKSKTVQHTFDAVAPSSNPHLTHYFPYFTNTVTDLSCSDTAANQANQRLPKVTPEWHMELAGVTVASHIVPG